MKDGSFVPSFDGSKFTEQKSQKESTWRKKKNKKVRVKRL